MLKMVLSSHLGRHLEYLIFPNSDEVAPDGFGFSTLKLPRISQKTLSVPKFKVFSFSTGLIDLHGQVDSDQPLMADASDGVLEGYTHN